MTQQLSGFDIRNFIDKLTPAREKGKYICPRCEGKNLSINLENGKYQCFNHCDCRDIRELIKPWREVMAERQGSVVIEQRFTSPQVEKINKPPKIPHDSLKIARINSPSNIPQPEKPQFIPESVYNQLKDKGATEAELSQIEVITYHYGDQNSILRYQVPCEANEKGREKTFAMRRFIDGKTQWNKGHHTWEAYCQNEAIASMKAVTDGVPVLLWPEGEKCTNAIREQGLASVCSIGSANQEDLVSILNNFKLKMGDRPFLIAYLQDNDETGSKKAQKLLKAAAQTKVSIVVINLKEIDSNLCDKGDVVDIFEAGMLGDELADAVLQQIEQFRNQQIKDSSESFDIPDSCDPDVTFLQQGFKFLYGDKHWISANGDLMYWTGTGYKHSPDSIERPKISSFCNSFVVANDEGKISYPYAKPSKVKELLEWVKFRVEIDPQLLNPPGVNCTNGILRIEWQDNKPVRKLDPHTPQDYFTYEPLVTYNPDADTTDCDRLLECLDEPQQQVLLRNLGASLDLEQVRRLRGREVKQLLACGLGSNGKDALRQVVSIIYGEHGMTSCSLADFSAYDEGRKFALAPLAHSRVNWASENPQTARLDKIQSLKLFATGNVLHSERKGKDHVEFIPKAIGIYNLNETPALQGVIQAILDRIAALEFRKTFKSNPDPDNPNELKADPRFSYDPNFVRDHVAPAFLNKMLDGLESLISEGIDYECTNETFLGMQKENNHLFQFVEDYRLGYRADNSMSAKELWDLLEQWYKESGTLAVDEAGRKLWVDQVRPSDKNVKGVNQVLPRILQLFPKATKTTRYCEISKRNIPIIKGIGFVQTIEPIQEITELIETLQQPIVESQEQTLNSIPEVLPEEDDLIVDANVELVRESISAKSWGMISELLEVWSEALKSSVWNRLTKEERLEVKELKSFEKQEHQEAIAMLVDKLPQCMTKQEYKAIFESVTESQMNEGWTLISEKEQQRIRSLFDSSV
jgi:putative DNA primase/helicase